MVMSETKYFGESSAAQFVGDQLAELNRSIREPAAIGIQNLIREELAEVWEECGEPNWDGYGAIPVSSDSYQNAQRLLLALPLGAKLPSVGAVPNGNITLEWHHSRRRSLTVAVGPDGDLNYAALIGSRQACGKEPFFDEAPTAILDLIAQIYQC